ncbi:MAG TPA: CDP-glycerol glycerophosphotransferase family protein, partial [Polyangiaceae bacterium]|nr:CDP-glycerol glycerophosphotransferase family protein [Polyangiaceae bacterium]
VGPVGDANPHFRWQALGDWDRAYRIRHSKLHPDNVHALGSPYSDWLLSTSSATRQLREALREKRGAQRSVLLALTWHHGGALRHWGDEEQLLTALVQHIRARGAFTLLRMHDRHRYHQDVIQRVERLAQRCGSALQLKWKDSSPDSLEDLLSSELCISNYSSILNHYYFTQRPSIHIDPHDVSAPFQRTYRMFLGRPWARWVRSPEQIWKLPLEEHGGLRAHSFEQLLGHVDQALDHPECCAERARSFVERYVSQADGASCARTTDFLRSWLGYGPAPQPRLRGEETQPQQDGV